MSGGLYIPYKQKLQITSVSTHQYERMSYVLTTLDLQPLPVDSMFLHDLALSEARKVHPLSLTGEAVNFSLLAFEITIVPVIFYQDRIETDV